MLKLKKRRVESVLKAEKGEYEKPKILLCAFQQEDVIRTSTVHETGGDTYGDDLSWFDNLNSMNF